MGYCASVHRIDFALLARVRGSRDGTLLRRILDEHPDEDEDLAEDEDPPLLFVQALEAIVNGGPIEDGSDPAYAVAADAIYAHFGHRLDSNPISPSSPRFLMAMEEAFGRAGVADKLPIFDSSRQPPLLAEPPEPFPVLSHMTPGEVAAPRGVLGAIDWSAEPREVREAIEMVERWIEEAAWRGQGLVCCYG